MMKAEWLQDFLLWTVSYSFNASSGSIHDARIEDT